MMVNKVSYEWKGNNLVQKVSVPDLEVTPKDVLDSLDQASGQLDKMNQQLKQLEHQKIQVEGNIKSAKEFVKDRKQFEERALELQKEKLDLLVRQVSSECKKKAQEQADMTIAKDPSAYTESQMANMYYVNYQRFLATHEKIANKIATRVIKDLLFDKPIFENPF